MLPATRTARHLRLGEVVAWCVDDEKLALYQAGNDEAWLAAEHPCDLRDWT